MKVFVRDGPLEWDGTGFASIECDIALAKEEKIGEISKDLKEKYIQISVLNNAVGARLKNISIGEGILTLDRLLRYDLQISENQEVEIKSYFPKIAEMITVAVPKSTLSQNDILELCNLYLKKQTMRTGQNKAIFLYSGEQVPIRIDSVVPDENSAITSSTKILIIASKDATRGGFFKDIGGLDREIQLIRERIELPIIYSESLNKLGIHPPRGVLLLGPPGCGKTMLARALSNEIGMNYFEINGPEILTPYYGESEKNLREIFKKAKEDSPAMILIDEIDAIAPSRNATRGELERRIVTTLLTEMDGLKENKNIIVVATTNIPDSIDPALRRPGRFDYEINIGIPNMKAREQILEIQTRRMKVNDKEKTILSISQKIHGFTGADIMLLCREAAYEALKRENPEILKKGIENLVFPEIIIQLKDFDEAITKIKPTGMREFAVEIEGNITWEDVGGLGEVKDIIQNEIITSIEKPDIFESIGIRPVKGILLHGPPGTGKTTIAKIIANHSRANFIAINGPEIFSKWFGESEQKIRQIFQKARECRPTIIFFDEIDAITAQRGGGQSGIADPIVNQLLTEIDGIVSSGGVYVIAATNRRELIDPAFLRPGRFDYHLFIPLPDEKGRYEIFTIHLKNKSISDDVDIQNLVRKTKDYSGAHIAEVCRRAALFALMAANFEPNHVKITMEHLNRAIEVVGESIKLFERPATGVEVM